MNSTCCCLGKVQWRKEFQVLLLLSILTVSLIVLNSFPSVSSSPSGPTTPNMLIKIFPSADAANEALESGYVDMNDWPLSRYWIDRWASNPNITMREYSPAIDNFQIDMNNQWWPTGAYDPGHSSAAPRNNMFNPTNIREVAALHFRRAVAHLTNKDKYTTVFMGGMGFVMETEVPVPALAGYTDYTTLKDTAYLPAYPGADKIPGTPDDWPSFNRTGNPYADNGFIYEYDRLAAEKELELGGFKLVGGVYKWHNPTSGLDEDLPNMKFWVRDEAPWIFIGRDMCNEMAAIGIPRAASAGAPGLELIEAPKSTCFTNAMVLYNYNFFVGGGWLLGLDVDFINDLYHSSMGQYSWATNYPGFKNDDFDQYAEQVKYPVSLWEARPAAIKAQWVKAKYVPVVHLWLSRGVKAYRTGWEWVVNMLGYGIDNYYSFILMSSPSRTLVWGISNKPSNLNIITSGGRWPDAPIPLVAWYPMWDSKVLSLIYDSLLGRNPFYLPEEVGWLSEKWSAGTWGTPTKTVAEFKVRTDATFHDGSPVKPADVAFSLLMPKAAGAGVAWNYPAVMDIDHVEIIGQTVKVYFGVQSAWALHWAGFMPIINKDLWWQAIGTGTSAGYTGWIADDTDGTFYPGTFSNAMAVRDYHPWESTAMGNPAVNDLTEDGSGAWKFISYVPSESVTLTAFTGYYEDPTIHSEGMWAPWPTSPPSQPPPPYPLHPYCEWLTIPTRKFVDIAFNRMGNVNFANGFGVPNGWYPADKIIDADDRYRVREAMPSWAYRSPWGHGYLEFNPDCDFNGDGCVDIEDKIWPDINFQKSMG